MIRSMMIAGTMLLTLVDAARCQEPADDAPKVAPKAKAAPVPRQSRVMVDTSWTFKAGDVGSIYLPSSPFVYAGLGTYGGYYDLMKAIKAKDMVGLDRLLAEKRIIKVPNGTKGLLVDLNTVGVSQGEPAIMAVRIKEGDLMDTVVLVSELWFARVVEVPVRMTPTQQAKAKVKARDDARKAKAEAKKEAEKADPAAEKP